MSQDSTILLHYISKLSLNRKPIANTGQNWYQWEVATDSKNYSETYAFRAVDATGTEDEQKYGGFLSAAFWIEGLQTISSSMSPNITRVSTSASAPVTMSGQ